MAALGRLEASLGRGDARDSPPAELARYRGRRWVTRPRPHVDRLSSAWLSRRFIDPEPEILCREAPQEGEVSFDMRDAEFGHRGPLCTFETLISAFGLAEDPALAAPAEIVHATHPSGGPSPRPEIPGVDGLLRGWMATGWSDAELEQHGIALFEGLYLGLRPGVPPASNSKTPGSTRRRKPKPTEQGDS